MTQADMVLKLKATLERRKAANAKVARVDAEEATLDAIIEQNGWDADELMRKAYGL